MSITCCAVYCSWSFPDAPVGLAKGVVLPALCAMVIHSVLHQRRLHQDLTGDHRRHEGSSLCLTSSLYASCCKLQLLASILLSLAPYARGKICPGRGFNQ